MFSKHNKTPKKWFVSEGLLKAELDAFLRRELADDGYGGIELYHTVGRTEVHITSTCASQVFGDCGRRLRELNSVVQQRFQFRYGVLELYVKRVPKAGLCAIVQVQFLKSKLMGGVGIRSACQSIIRYVMDSGAQGCEVAVSGKLSGERSRTMKIKDGIMIHAGDSDKTLDVATCHVILQHGVVGLKVSIHLPLKGRGGEEQEARKADKIIFRDNVYNN